MLASDAPIGDFIVDVKRRAPDGDDSTIYNLAVIERLIAYHGEKLAEHLDDAFATKQLQSLTGDAIRLRAALGVGNKQKAQPQDAPAPIRRDT